MRLRWGLIFLVLMLCSRGYGQTPAPEAAPPHSSARQEEKPRLTVNPLTGLVTASSKDYHPLTAQERWKLYFKQNYWSAGAYIGPVASALIYDQARGQPPEWGGGFEGYGRRLASRLGTGAIQGSIQAPVAALMKYDVRYIGSGESGFKKRLGHAVAYSFLTYNQKGRPRVNFPNIGAYYAASAISTSWQPGNQKVASYALRDGSVTLAFGVVVNVVQEFWPDVMHRLRHR
jgi:hypothetical protein